MITHKTTKAHFDKYAALKKELNITFKNSNGYLGYTKEELLQLFREDPGLKNIPGHLFRSYASGVLTFNKAARKKGLTIWECACLAKHCLVYEILEAKPVFDG